MPCLAVVPGNTIDDLIDKGLLQRFSGYYNPRGYFDRVVILSPFETAMREVGGMTVIPTKDHQLPSRLKAAKADLVRAYGGGTSADMAVFYRRAGIPVIVSIHDKRSSMIHPGIVHADIVFAVSQELRLILIARGVRPERIMVVPNGVDGVLMRPVSADAFADLTKRYPFKYKLLHVGRKSPEKNIEALIFALARLGPDYGLVAVGQGNTDLYEALALAQGVADRCIFLPGMPQEGLACFYNWADCVCHPSRSEAMCNVLLEALACGAAVVSTVTAATGLGEAPLKALRLVIDPGNIVRLSEEIRSVCQDPDIRAQLRASARASVEPLFLEQAQAHEIACYKKVLDMQAQGLFRRSLADNARLCVANTLRRVSRVLGTTL
ncbi:MAG: glycosyltransferase family 4 protein [Candidatus Omnitrophica bacterium]|nr:glycosyltransferase family 4 protein [Candidatus Omnitrophota bacterium]